MIYYANNTVKSINVDDNTGTFTYNDAGDPRTSTEFNSTANKTTYDDNTYAEFTYGNNYDIFYDVNDASINHAKRYFNVSATLSPNLRTDIANL